MRLAFTDNIPKATKQYIQNFGGLNRTRKYMDNEFVYMDGVSLDDYPYISTRPVRVEYKITFPERVIEFVHHEGIVLVVKDDTIEVYRNENKPLREPLGTYPRKDMHKKKDAKLVVMGAYIVIFPDKVCYDTTRSFAKHRAFKNLEVEFVPGSDIIFEPAFTNSTFTRIKSPGIGNAFNKYDSIVISGCIKSEYNTSKVITEKGDDYIVVAGVLKDSFTQARATGLHFARKVPDMSHICEANNRIWGCSMDGHEIYASKLGDPFNFNNFENISTDSYAVNVGSQGRFTACIKHMGNILFFKENIVHKLFGDRPANFQINDYNFKGVKEGEEKSLQIINEVLYYVGVDGIYAYDGSIPYRVSEKLGDCDIEKSVGANYKGNYYLSAKLIYNRTSKSECGLYIYYPEFKSICVDEVLEEKGLWNCADAYKNNINYIVAEGNGSSYKELIKDNTSRSMSFQYVVDNSERKRFKLISAAIISSSMFKKFVSKLMFDFELYAIVNNINNREEKAYVDIYLKYDEEPLWEKVYSVTGEKRKVHTVPIIPRRCESFRYKIEGRGGFVLRGICKFVEEGSEVDGNF